VRGEEAEEESLTKDYEEEDMEEDFDANDEFEVSPESEAEE